jgi:hypothetical protein
MTGVVEGFRWALLGGVMATEPPGAALCRFGGHHAARARQRRHLLPQHRADVCGHYLDWVIILESFVAIREIRGNS